MERRPYLVNRAFRSFLLATVMSTMAVSFGSMLGSIVVGNVLGSDALGAVNVMMPVIQLLAATNALINIGGATVMAISMGRGRECDIRGIFTKSMGMSVAASALIACIGVAFIDPIMDCLCTTDSLRPMARDYGALVFATSPLYLLMPGLGTFVRTDNDPRLATSAFVAANITNIVLAYILMSSTDMGLAGFAASTATGYLVGIAVLLIHFRRPSCSLGFGKGEIHARDMLAMGAPASLAMMMILVNMLGMNLIVMKHMGSDGMAIRSVCLNIQMLSSIFVSGISQTLQPVGGTLYGSEDLTGMRMVTRLAARYQVAASGTIMVLALVCPYLFLLAFGVTDADIVPEAEHCIRLFAPFLIFQAMNYMVLILFQVFGHRPISIAISIAECFSVLILAYVLSEHGTDWIWMSFGLGEALVSAGILAASWIICRRNPDYSGIALFRKPHGMVFEASVPGDGAGMEEALDGLEKFVGGCSGPDEAARSRVCCEEIVLNSIEHGLGRDPSRIVDIIARCTDDGILITIRDDGPMFDPVKHERYGMGLRIARSQCASFSYARSINQNNVFLRFARFCGSAGGVGTPSRAYWYSRERCGIELGGHAPMTCAALVRNGRSCQEAQRDSGDHDNAVRIPARARANDSACAQGSHAREGRCGEPDQCIRITCRIRMTTAAT